MALDQLTDTEKEALAIGERLEQQEQERDQRIYENAREGEQETLQFAGKFRTVDDLEKAYLELQKKLGSKTTDDTTTTNTEEEPTDDEPTEEPAPAEVREEEGRGDQEAEPQPALSAEDAKAILDAVGGQEAYSQMIEWGKESLSEADQTAYNQVLATANPSAIRLATEGLMARYRATADFQGNPVKGRPGSSEPGAKPYRSRAEVNAAMSDYRYEVDPAYRNDVMARLSVSPEDLL